MKAAFFGLVFNPEQHSAHAGQVSRDAKAEARSRLAGSSPPYLGITTAKVGALSVPLGWLAGWRAGGRAGGEGGRGEDSNGLVSAQFTFIYTGLGLSEPLGLMPAGQTRGRRGVEVSMRRLRR
ncbi:hypothetical protein AOLI_G00078710 [Acnodon oligacanthus]